jgi:putative membrane protein
VSRRADSTPAVVSASIAVGLAISSFLMWLIYLRAPADVGGDALAFLPGFNASCNALSAACLVAGFVAIRRRRPDVHMRFMLAALTFSALFLAGYVTHHALHGDTRFAGVGTARTVYLSMLASHVVLSIVALPMIVATLWFAISARFSSHRRIARVTLPIWLYVSVTGVTVYVFLRAYA